MRCIQGSKQRYEYDKKDGEHVPRNVNPNNPRDVSPNHEHVLKEYANKNKETKTNECPWKIMIQNMEGLVSKNSKEKVELLREYVKEDNVIIMNLTETWLDETVEEIVDVEGYRIFRSDRKGRERNSNICS